MRRRAALIASVLVASLLMAGCRSMPPLSEPDRSEVVPVPGGRCEISWWLSPAVDEPPAEAGRLAAEALDEATVSDAQWASWFRLLDDDPDLDSLPVIRLHGSAYLEAVREDVRSALDDAGYPDTERVIDVYSNLSCG